MGRITDWNDGSGYLGEHSRVLELEAQVEALEAALAASEERHAETRRRLEAWISVISHDLRGPLTLILGHAENLQLRAATAAGSERARGGLSVIVTAGRRLNKMVTQVVDATRLDLGSAVSSPREVSLPAVVDDEVRRLRRDHSGRTVRVDVPPNLPYGFGDPRRISQIIEALLSNAIVFSPDGGDVVVKGWAVEDAVALSVSDRGVGVTPDELARVFERFFRPERLSQFPRTGLGLSLATSREFARSFGGDITCESDGVARGARFTLLLPIAPDPPDE